MSPPSPLLSRTKEFTHRCIKLASALPKNPLAEIIRKQLLKCSTSVAANYRAAFISPTRKSFGHKLSICAEEADESAFWIELIQEQKIIKGVTFEMLQPLWQEAVELTKIFVSSRKTLLSKRQAERSNTNA